MRYFLPTFFILLFFLLSTSLTFGQTATSQCVTTKIGTPSGTPPPLPPGCLNFPEAGSYHFPLRSTEDITNVLQEMASYAYSFTFGGHTEHAGLDLMTTPGAEVPVYAITDGTIQDAPPPFLYQVCRANITGCTIRINHTTDTLHSTYMHIVPSKPFRVGDPVRKGDLLGTVNIWNMWDEENNRWIRNDHLHFELREQADEQVNRHNINPRNYFPELQQFGLYSGYFGNVRTHSASRGIYLLNDGLEWPEKFQYHPPCLVENASSCWAH